MELVFELGAKKLATPRRVCPPQLKLGGVTSQYVRGKMPGSVGATQPLGFSVKGVE